MRHNLVQRIVKAYERYNEMMGAGRQLTLRLSGQCRRDARGTWRRSRERARSSQRLRAFPCRIPNRWFYSVTLQPDCAAGRSKSSRANCASAWRADAEFQCLITGDEELRRLNRQFLGKDYPTDVLSFPAGDDDMLGEIAISAERAAEQAREFGHSVEDEIRILMLHGVLHLAGMDHERDRGAMARAETALAQEARAARGLDRTGRARELRAASCDHSRRGPARAGQLRCSCFIWKVCGCARATCHRSNSSRAPWKRGSASKPTRARSRSP